VNDEFDVIAMRGTTGKDLYERLSSLGRHELSWNKIIRLIIEFYIKTLDLLKGGQSFHEECPDREISFSFTVLFTRRNFAKLLQTQTT